MLFTSFEQYTPLMRVLDQIGQMFDPMLQRSGIQWQAITDTDQKRQIVQQILTQVPVLWIWDNVEPVAGFPSGTPSAWSDAEQRDLVDFLRMARGTKATFLLTSRRDERGWLGDLPVRITIPPMPMQERWHLTRELAARASTTIDKQAWRSLLVYSGGNPLTLTVVVRQALRDGLRSKKQIDEYVQKLRAGEATFEDDVSQGRSKSLGASLSYGFEHAFSDEERRVLALLHHFQGFVQDGTLRLMIDSLYPASEKYPQSQAIVLLDRATEMGLLQALGGGSYTIHPALPWFFRHLYEECYPDNAPTRAYVEAMSSLGNHYHNRYEDGNREVIAVLKLEEANLRHALYLSHMHKWYDAMIQPMQGLRALLVHTAQWTVWRRLVDEIMPNFVDSETGKPLPGREKQWSVVLTYRVQILRKERQWDEATRLQGLVVAWERQRATPLRLLDPAVLDEDQRNMLRPLAAALHLMGETQREQGNIVCVESYQESYEIAQRIGAQNGAATCALNLGHTYMGIHIPALRDLDQAEQWYQRSLEMRPKSDSLERGRVLGQLGHVARERLKDTYEAGEPAAILQKHLNTALHFCQQKQELIPPDAIGEWAITHHQIGNTYYDAGQNEQAIAHYRKAIPLLKAAGNSYEVAQTHHNMALAYYDADRFDDALLFAQAALRGFEQFGPAAADEIAKTQQVIGLIEDEMRKGGG